MYTTQQPCLFEFFPLPFEEGRGGRGKNHHSIFYICTRKVTPDVPLESGGGKLLVCQFKMFKAQHNQSPDESIIVSELIHQSLQLYQ